MRAGGAAFVLMIWAALAGVAPAQTAAQQEEIARAERIGRELYEHDQAAWHGTDLAQDELRRADMRRVRGYLTERVGDSVAVVFVTEDRQAVYRAVYRNGAMVEHTPAQGALTEAQQRIMRARDIAMAAAVTSDFQQCAPDYNTATIVRPAPGGNGVDIDVYLMPSQTQERVLPIGGYYRLGVDIDSGEVKETQAFSRSCLVMELMEQTEAIVFTHIVTDTPTETHVFINLTQGVPLYVTAGGQMWSVQEGRILPMSAEAK